MARPTIGDLIKDHTFKLRLGSADRARLDALSEHYAAPVATVIRMLVKRDADKLGVVKPAKRKAGAK